MRGRTTLIAGLLLALTAVAPAHADAAASGESPLPCGDGTATQLLLPYPQERPPLSTGLLMSVDTLSPKDVWFTTNRDVGIKHYDGTSIRDIPRPVLGSSEDRSDTILPGGKLSFSSDSDGWVIGYYLSLEEQWLDNSVVTGEFPFHPLVQRWNGKRWITVAPVVQPDAKHGSAEFTGVLDLGPRDAWLVGSAPGADDERALIEHWDGRRWQVVPHPGKDLPGSIVTSISGTDPDDIWVVGRYFTDDGLEIPYSEHWDGHRWTLVPTAGLNGDPAYLSSVSVRASNDVWAAGGRIHGSSHSLVQHWDGARWTAVPGVDDFPSSFRHGVYAAGPDDVYVIGSDVRHFDGRSWSPVPVRDPEPATGHYQMGIDGSGPGDVWIGGSLVTYSVLDGGPVDQELALHVCRH